MKTIIMALTLSISFANADKISKDPPEYGFMSELQLQEWAMKSAFGGGYVKEIMVEDRKVYYSNRSFTSGRQTTQVTFFYVSQLGRIIPFTALPTKLGNSTITIEGDNIIVNQKSEISMDIRYTIKSKQIPQKKLHNKAQ